MTERPSPLRDPDFADLTLEQRQVVERGILAAVRGLDGLTPLQRRLLRAISRAVLGLDGVTGDEEPASEEELATALEGAPPRTKRRVVQLMLMLELLLHPLPHDIEEHVESFARALGVDEGLLRLTRRGMDLARNLLDLR